MAPSRTPRIATRTFPLQILLLIAAPALAQKTAPQKSVTITVVDAHVDPAQPVPTVRVSLTYLDGSSPITEARDVTNPRGQAFLQVSPDAAQRDDLRLVIEGNSKLVIFEPADGQLHGLATNVPIKLLPQGSAALMGPAQIEAVMRRLSQRAAALQTQVNTMKATAEPSKPAVNGFDEWAKTSGLDPKAAKEKILEWAHQIEAEPVSRGLGEEPGLSAAHRALAAFALTDYAGAADLFGESTDAQMAALSEPPGTQELTPEQKAQDVTALQKLLQTAKQQSNALQMLSRYHDAAATLTKVRGLIQSRHQASPQDDTLTSVYLDAVAATAKAQRAEDIAAPK